MAYGWINKQGRICRGHEKYLLPIHFCAELDSSHTTFCVLSSDMKYSSEQILGIACPTCGAKAGEKCELNTGRPRTSAHRNRRLAAEDLEDSVEQGTRPDTSAA
jgi:hypothetical protein